MFLFICLFTLFSSTVFAILSGALRGALAKTANECESLCSNVTSSDCSRNETLLFSSVSWTGFTGLLLTEITSTHTSHFELALFNASGTDLASRCVNFKIIWSALFEKLRIASTGYDPGLNWLCAPVCNDTSGLGYNMHGPCVDADGTPSASSLLACARPAMLSDSVLWYFKLALALINTFVFTPLRLFVVTLPRLVRAHCRQSASSPQRYAHSEASLEAGVLQAAQQAPLLRSVMVRYRCLHPGFQGALHRAEPSACFLPF